MAAEEAAELDCVLADSNDEKAGAFDRGGAFFIYMRSPKKREFERRQFVRIDSDRGQHVFRYVMPWAPLKESQLLIDYDTFLSLGFEYDDITNGLAKVEINRARPYVDQIVFALKERHPEVRIALVSGLVSGVITGGMFLLVDKLL